MQNESEVKVGKYIHFTKNEIDEARNANLASFLLSRGAALERSGSEYIWPQRHVTIRGNVWFDQYTREGGNALDFVMCEYSLPFQDAVAMLAGSDNGAGPVEKIAGEKQFRRVREFELPDRNIDMKRAFAYLVKTRRIDPHIVSFFAARGLIYEDAGYHNAVFVGRDENGIARHAHRKSTVSGKIPSGRWTVEGSDGRYAFHYIGRDNIIFAFEAPIDMLSFITLNKDDWQGHSYVSLCSVSDKPLVHLLEMYPHIRVPVICTDNDTAGREAAARIKENLIAMGYPDTRIELPQLKDWNEELVSGREAAPAVRTVHETLEMEGNTCLEISQG